MRPIHLLGSPVLRQHSDEVTCVDDEVRKLVRDLFDTMYTAEGIGLAANQVGLTIRVAVVHAGDDPAVVLINPVIIEREGNEKDEEGCLSLPDLFGDVDRALRVVVETTNLDGARERHELTALSARAVQHEIDHLDGKLFIDHLSPLKRLMLLKKWKKLRKGQKGYIEEVSPAKTPGS
ncbi:MAG: peptide deformylase [Gemmatimonadetes bacterium]|nr:peptide deformylase [Gemmatimonadota bacterium]